MELAATGLAQFHVGPLADFAAEEQFLLGAGVVIGTVKHQAEDEQTQLLVEQMSGEFNQVITHPSACSSLITSRI